MGHYAEVINGVVSRVIVAEQEFIDSGAVGNPSRWIKTSYNTFGGQHKFGGTPLRKNYAGIGYQYDERLDAFIPPKPYPSWVLNETTCLYDPPRPYPNEREKYIWDEATLNWKEITESTN